MNMFQLEERIGRCRHVIDKAIKLNGFPEGILVKKYKTRERRWDENEVSIWLSQNNFPGRRYVRWERNK